MKPLKDPLGVSPSIGNQGTTRGSIPTEVKRIFFTSCGPCVPRTRLSSCPKPFCFLRGKVGCLCDICLCHTAMSLLSCLCRHLLSGCLRAGCLYLCRSAHTYVHILLSSGCRRSHTSISCCSQESSCLCIRACSAPAGFIACGFRPCRFQRW